jgi:Flp pilus assembly secretin CpaC
MMTLQKTFVAAMLVAAVSFGICEVRQASMLRHEVQTLQQEHASLSEKIRQLQLERGNAVKSEGNGVGILADKNFRMVLHALEQRTGVETLGEPEATTISGRGIQGQFVNVVFPVFTNPPPFSTQRRAE